MRIGFVTFEYPPHTVGGAGTYAQMMVREMAGLGHDVVVFTPRGRYDRPPGVTFHEVPFNEGRPLGALQFWLGLPSVVRRAERDKEFDIIHVNGTSYWFLGKVSNSPLVVTIHHLAKDAAADGPRHSIRRLARLDKESGPLLPLIEKRALRLSSRVVAVSNFTRERIIRSYAVDPGKIGVVHNGSSHDASSPVDISGAEALLRPLGGSRTILFVGRLNDPRKGLDVLLRAMPSVLDRVDAVLVAAGHGDQAEIRKSSDRLGLNGRVLFLGHISDPVLLGLYRSCDVYVCPSRLEGFGLTVLDAQLFGRKVIATRVGAIPEIAAKDTALVTSDDPEELASAIVETLLPCHDRNAEPNDGTGAARELWRDAARKTIGEYEIVLRNG